MFVTNVIFHSRSVGSGFCCVVAQISDFNKFLELGQNFGMVGGKMTRDSWILQDLAQVPDHQDKIEDSLAMRFFDQLELPAKVVEFVFHAGNIIRGQSANFLAALGFDK